MTYQEFIDAAIFQSGTQLTDAQAEALVPSVFQNVAMAYAANPHTQSLLRRTHTLSVVNGVATLPAEVLSAGKVGAVVSDPVDLTVAQNQAMVWFWNDFVAPRSGILSQIPQWIIRGDDEFHYLEANESYDPSSGFTGDLEIDISSVPEIPATAGATLDVPSEVLSDLIEALAVAIRNQAKAVA